MFQSCFLAILKVRQQLGCRHGVIVIDNSNSNSKDYIFLSNSNSNSNRQFQIECKHGNIYIHYMVMFTL